MSTCLVFFNFPEQLGHRFGVSGVKVRDGCKVLFFFFSKCNIHFWNDVVFLSNGLVNYQQSSRELWFTLVEIEQASPRN